MYIHTKRQSERIIQVGKAETVLTRLCKLRGGNEDITGLESAVSDS